MNNIIRELEEHILWMEKNLEEYNSRDPYDDGYITACTMNLVELRRLVKEYRNV